MNLKLSKKKSIVLVAALVATAATVAYCSTPTPDIASSVLDVDTGEPIEGAYVLAIYNETGSTPFGHSGKWCVKTKGMYTGKDGAFRFPAENAHQPEVHVIKPDYFWTYNTKGPAKMEWTLTGQRVVHDPNFYLKRQDLDKPEWNLGGKECERPKTQEDAVANVEFLRIERAELIKQGDIRRADSVLRQIKRLDSMP